MTRATDTSKEAREVITEIYRRMSPAEKLTWIFDAYQAGKVLAIAGLRLRHPEATSEQLHRFWAKQHLGEELFEEVYGDRPDAAS